MLLAAAATLEVETTKLEAEAKDLEARETEDENDMACKWHRQWERYSLGYHYSVSI